MKKECDVYNTVKKYLFPFSRAYKNSKMSDVCRKGGKEEKVHKRKTQVSGLKRDIHATMVVLLTQESSIKKNTIVCPRHND